MEYRGFGMLKKYFHDQNFAALLFDFDGTIADTMPAHLEAWNQVLSVHKLTLSKEQHLAWAGRPTREIVRLLNELHLTNMSYEVISKTKELHYMRSLAEIKEIVPVADIIRHYHGQLPMAVVSGSRHRPVDTTLEHLNLTQYFDAVVCAEDYTVGKPAPDCFLQAAKLLKVKSEHCLVFEDGELGIQAAKAAGMAYLRVSESSPSGHEIRKL
jgi:beta-phosphoglucomutase family hydrolase